MRNTTTILAIVFVASCTSDTPKDFVEPQPLGSTPTVSSIGIRIYYDGALNGVLAAISILTYLQNDATLDETVNLMNLFILENGGNPLTKEEIQDIMRMKNYYSRLDLKQQNAYRDELLAYSQILSEPPNGPSVVTIEWWDSQFGLSRIVDTD